jgi:SAM-dependent methyltransferase
MVQQEQMDFFHEIFDASLPRLGPGDDASTQKALRPILSMMPIPHESRGPSRLRVLDIGCGNGPQTLALARNIEGFVVAVDNHKPFLDELNRRARAAGLADKIEARHMDMAALTPEAGLYDLVWSEGALNLMGFSEGALDPDGFRDGLKLCHRLLEPGGGLGISELCWFKPDPPPECRKFFEMGYPAMAGVEANLELMASCGFEVIGHFPLPESAWWESYLNPLGGRLASLRDRYAGDQEKRDFIESIQVEIDLYRGHSSWYGLEFFMMRRSQD